MIETLAQPLRVERLFDHWRVERWIAADSYAVTPREDQAAPEPVLVALQKRPGVLDLPHKSLRVRLSLTLPCAAQNSATAYPLYA